MKPICVPCQRFYRPKKNGTFFIEGMPREGGAQPGKREPEKWGDYKLWCGDLWVCEDCGSEVIVGVGSVPVAEHYQDGFAKMKMAYNPSIKINDC